MRQIRQVGPIVVQKDFKLDDSVVLHFGSMLNTKEMLHIEELHFTNDGQAHFHCHLWKEDKQLYSFLNMETRPFGLGVKLMKFGRPENKIVFSITAEELVEKYYALLKKIEKETKK